MNKDQAFASSVLSSELGRAVQLGDRDRALATELVYGTLRHQAGLLKALSAHTPRGIESLDEAATRQLLLGAYQLLFLDRVPPFAVVSDAVSLVKRERGERLGGFVNAVLRRFHERVEKERDTLRKAVRVDSRPAWLASALARSIGPSALDSFFEWAEEAPVPVLCVRRANDRASLLERLRAHAPDASFEPGLYSPHAIRASRAGSLAKLPGYGTEFIVQEEGSQLIALLAGARAGERALDACAGRGNKTAMLAHPVAPGGSVDACDLHPKKIEQLEAQMREQGLGLGQALAVDWSVGAGGLAGPYDRVLVDAPCSGTGTIARRPDLLLRRTESEAKAHAWLSELADLQLAIVRQVAPLVGEGKSLTYAICSLLRDEAEEVVQRILAETSLELAPWTSEGALELVTSLAKDERAVALRASGEPCALRLLPHVHGTDGYFIANFRRK